MMARRGTSVLLGCALLGLSCTSASSSALSRMTAAHNALEATGQARLGRVFEGWLGEGTTHSIAIELEPRCYTIGAFAADSLRAVELSVAARDGALVERSAVESSPVLRVCAPRSQRYTVTLRAVQGSGAWALATWSGARASSADRRSEHESSAVEGSCGRAIDLALSATTAGDTRAGQSAIASTCSILSADASAPELVYRVEVPRRMLLTARARATWDVSVAIRRYCSEHDSELSCSPRVGDEARATALVDPGTYFVIVDSRSADSGAFSLELDASEAPNAESDARALPELVSGVAVESSTVGQFDWFSSPCQRANRGPDRTFRLHLDQRSRVQVTVESSAPHAVAIRRSYSPAEAPVACVAGIMSSSRRFRVNEWLDVGDWFVTVDASAARWTSDVRVRADVFAPRATSSSTPGDPCSTAPTLSPGVELTVNTLDANDDLRAPCGSDTAAPERVFRLDLDERSLVRVRYSGDPRRVRTWWLDRCDGAPSPNTCAVVASSLFAPSHDQLLDRGRHYLAVESVAPQTFGELVIRADLHPAAPIVRSCAAATALPARGDVRGTLVGGGALTGSCTADEDGPERVYRFELRRRSSVQLTLRSLSGRASSGEWIYKPALFIRRDCALPASEVDCRDSDTQSVVASNTLDPGEYFVVVDGELLPNERASFVLESLIEPE